MCTDRQVPVDVGNPGVQVEGENQEEDSGHHEGAAADKLEEVDASTRGTHHDRFDANESDERKDLEEETRAAVRGDEGDFITQQQFSHDDSKTPTPIPQPCQTLVTTTGGHWRVAVQADSEPGNQRELPRHVLALHMIK